MFGFIKRMSAPFASLGNKIRNVFSLGSKVSPIIQDARNVGEFINVAPQGLRFRAGVGSSDIFDKVGKGFFGNMPSFLTEFKYPN